MHRLIALALNTRHDVTTEVGQGAVDCEEVRHRFEHFLYVKRMFVVQET